jgi:hypothetical protein
MAWKIFSVDALLLAVYTAMLFWLWKVVPHEGVKLHGTVDLGVDLLGSKNDLLWFGGFGGAIFLINVLLALLLARREKVASLYLLFATGMIFFLLIGTLLFLFRLNKIF